MVARTPHAHRVFFQRAQPWGRLARVHHRRTGAGDSCYACGGQRRNATEPAEEVERRPLARQQGACVAHHRRHLRARLHPRALHDSCREAHLRIEQAKSQFRQGQPGDDACRARDDAPARTRAGRDRRRSRHVTPADVLGQRPPHELHIEDWVEAHAVE